MVEFSYDDKRRRRPWAKEDLSSILSSPTKRNEYMTPKQFLEKYPDMLTVELIEERLKDIYKSAIVDCDDEVAHGKEDDLLWSFISFLGKIDQNETSLDEVKIMAKKIMKSKMIDFSRWCA